MKHSSKASNSLSTKNKATSKIIETSEGKANEEGFPISTCHIIAELIEYIPNSILRKTIMKNATGHITVSSFEADEALTESITPFSTFIQIIEGKAEIVISKRSTTLLCGQSIIIPAHISHIVKADGRFKMLQAVMKSEDEM